MTREAFHKSLKRVEDDVLKMSSMVGAALFKAHKHEEALLAFLEWVRERPVRLPQTPRWTPPNRRPPSTSYAQQPNVMELFRKR